MKKTMAILTISFSALMASSLSSAAPHFDHRGDDHPRSNQGKGRDFRDFDQDDERMQDKRHRGNGYKVDYKDHSLPKPARNQQWYKINNDYILIDSGSNDILRIVND